MSVDHDPLPQSHPCTKDGCGLTVAYDDEPFCFTHSPDSGSTVPGYSYRASQTSKYENLRFKSPADAARVVTSLLTHAHFRSVMTVAYLHEICDVSGHYTDRQWGWTASELQLFDIKVVEDGYELILPDPKRL